MTNHVTEQELLEHALGTLDDEWGRRVRHHCEECPSCKEALQTVAAFIDRLRVCDATIDVTPPDLMQALHRTDSVPVGVTAIVTRSLRKRAYEILRLAAVLCMGIGIGYGAAVLAHQPLPRVVRQQFVSRTIQAQGPGFLSCRVDGLVRR